MASAAARHMEISQFTRNLCDYSHKYHAQASQEGTLKGKIKTHLMGRVLVLGVSLLLHAEAVCRAVYVCFLMIKDIFSHSTQEIISKQKEFCARAYSASWESFSAFFIQSRLKKFTPPVESFAPQQRLPVQINVESFAPQQRLPVQISIEKAPLAAPSESEARSLTSDTRPGGACVHVAESDDCENISSPPRSDLDFVVTDSSVANTPQRKASSVFTSPELIPMPAPKLPSAHESDGASTQTFDSKEFDTGSITSSEKSSRQVLLAEHKPTESSLERARHLIADRFVLTNLVVPLPQERKELEALEAQLNAQYVTLAAELAPLSKKEVEDGATDALKTAERQIDQNSGNFRFMQGPDDLKPGWTVESNNQDCREPDFIQAGFCKFTEGPDKLQPEFIMEKGSVRIKNTRFNIHFFGVCDPQVGQRASLYLKQNLCNKVLDKLSTVESLKDKDIYNALSSAVIALNEAFLSSFKDKKVHPLFPRCVADDRSSFTLVVVFNSQAWLIQIGDTKAVLNLGGKSLQYTETPYAALPKYRRVIEKLGAEVDESGLLNSELKTATIFGGLNLNGAARCAPTITSINLTTTGQECLLAIGTSKFFENISSRNIADLLFPPDKTAAEDLAYDLGFSIHECFNQIDRDSIGTMVMKLFRASSSWVPIDSVYECKV